MLTSTLSFCCSALTSLMEAGSVANGPSMTVTDSPTSKSTRISGRSRLASPPPADEVLAATFPVFFAAPWGSRNLTTSSSDSAVGREVAPTNPVTPGVLRTVAHESSVRSIRTRM